MKWYNFNGNKRWHKTRNLGLLGRIKVMYCGLIIGGLRSPTCIEMDDIADELKCKNCVRNSK